MDQIGLYCMKSNGQTESFHLLSCGEEDENTDTRFMFVW